MAGTRPTAPALGAPQSSLYDVLGLSATASDTEVRRSYRNLLTKSHPDKGGDVEAFKQIQTAYEVLSDAGKRRLYDETGRIQKSPDQEFADFFAGGSFRDPAAALAAREGGAAKAQGMADQIILRHASGEAQSHSAGFEAWMRSRGGPGTVVDAESVAAQFGVAKASYDAVPLPRDDIYQAVCSGPGSPSEALAVRAAQLPLELEWGQVLVHMRHVPINPADTYTARLGGVYGSECATPPFIAGHDGVGLVAKVGPGVRTLQAGDLIMPLKPLMGSWATAAVWPERSLLKLPQDGFGLPLEYLAMAREMAVAYRLLEAHGSLQPGDCVILNAANSTVGQVMLQLARLLRLRAVAVVRPPPSSSSSAAAAGSEQRQWDRTASWLKGLGAAEVLRDEGSLKLELDKLRFFSRPKLALDSVGGDSAVRLAEVLAEGGELVVYGCMSGKAPAWPWQAWVFRDLQVRGFNLRRWASSNPSRLLGVLQALSKLVNANMLQLNFTEYDFMTEFSEALSHAQDSGRNTKVLLKMDPRVGQPLAADVEQPVAAAATAEPAAAHTSGGAAAVAAAAGGAGAGGAPMAEAEGRLGKAGGAQGQGRSGVPLVSASQATV